MDIVEINRNGKIYRMWRFVLEAMMNCKGS